MSEDIEIPVVTTDNLNNMIDNRIESYESQLSMYAIKVVRTDDPVKKKEYEAEAKKYDELISAFTCLRAGWRVNYVKRTYLK